MQSILIGYQNGGSVEDLEDNYMDCSSAPMKSLASCGGGMRMVPSIHSLNLKVLQ